MANGRQGIERMRMPVPPGLRGGGNAGGQSGVVPMIKFQPGIAFEGRSATAGQIIQPTSGWLDGDSADSYRMDVKILSMSATLSLVIESAPAPEGPWTAATSFTTVTATNIVLSSEGGAQNFSRFVRWRVDLTGAGAWNVCFQLLATPGKGSPAAQRLPRRV